MLDELVLVLLGPGFGFGNQCFEISCHANLISRDRSASTASSRMERSESWAVSLAADLL